MGQGIVIYGMPVSSDKCRYEQDQCAFRLVKIRYQNIYDSEFESRNDNDSCSDAQSVERVLLKIGDERIDGLFCRIGVLSVIWGPLFDIMRLSCLDT